MPEPSLDRVQGLFDQAVALPPERRAVFLRDACAGDSTLRAEVEALLAWDASDADLPRSPLVRDPETAAPHAPSAGFYRPLPRRVPAG